MSRTVKTTKIKFRTDKTWGMPKFGGGFINYTSWLEDYVNPKFYSSPKLRKEKDYKDHWMSTPSEWTRLTMNRPMRRKLKTKLSILKNVEPSQELLEEFDEEEGYKKKPHNYYL